MHAHEYFKQIKINMLKQNMVNLFNLRDLRDLIKRFNFANQKKTGFFCFCFLGGFNFANESWNL